MRKIKEGNITRLVPEKENTMNLRCSNCGLVKNELDIDTKDGVLTCECGSSSFIVQCDLEELM